MTSLQPLLPLEAPAASPPRIDAEFDEAFANQMAKMESYNKHHYRPNTYLHKWWARRCGSTFRLILKALSENELAKDYYSPGGLEGKIILDPMMGGGTTVHEALRLGATVVGGDLDPIPILQARATLSYAALEELEAGFEHLYATVNNHLAPLMVTDCPVCQQKATLRLTLFGQVRHGADGAALFVDSLTLRKQTDGTTLSFCPETHGLVRDGVLVSQPAEFEPMPVIFGRGRRAAARKFVPHLQTPFYKRYRPIMIVGRCKEHGVFYKAPDAADFALIRQADSLRPVFHSADMVIGFGPKTKHLHARDVHCYDDLFSSRQLIYLCAAQEALTDLDELVRLNLALLVSTSLEFNSMLCGYKGARSQRPGAIRHAFAYHAYSFPHTALENNPLFEGHKASGTLTNLFHRRIRRARQWAMRPVERVPSTKRWRHIKGEWDFGDEMTALVEANGKRQFLLRHGSSAALNLPDESIDHVVTDPPYFDSVQYGDLAAFFHVWLKQLVPDAAAWEYDLDDAAVHPHASNGEQYETVLGEIFSECHRVLKKERGRLVFSFHHWKPRAWSALTVALRRANFVLVNAYVVHAENPISVHVAQLNSLLHDAILVLGSAETTPEKTWQPPDRPNSADSETFCRDCASQLGHLLSDHASDKEIHQIWRDYLRVRQQ